MRKERLAPITSDTLAGVLKRLPEKKFRIMELAPQLLNEYGGVDVMKAMDRQPELNTAILEVQTYIKEVREIYRVVLCLGRSNADDDPDELLGVEDEQEVGDER